jgi:hypothetical protein
VFNCYSAVSVGLGLGYCFCLVTNLCWLSIFSAVLVLVSAVGRFWCCFRGSVQFLWFGDSVLVLLAEGLAILFWGWCGSGAVGKIWNTYCERGGEGLVTKIISLVR